MVLKSNFYIIKIQVKYIEYHLSFSDEPTRRESFIKVYDQIHKNDGIAIDNLNAVTFNGLFI